MEEHLTDKKQQATALFEAVWDQYLESEPAEIQYLEPHFRMTHRALDLYPSLGDDPRVPLLMGNTCALLGWLYADLENEERSLFFYNEALAFLPLIENPCWHEYWSMGKCLAAIGHFEESIEACENALNRATPENSRGHIPDDDSLAAIWSDLSDSYTDLAGANDSIECLEVALSYAPDDEVMRCALIIKCLEEGRADEAVAYARSGLESGFENKDLLHESLAMGAAITGENGLAIDSYHRLLDGTSEPEAREHYSHMIGYLEGLRDTSEDARRWDNDTWEWTFFSIGEKQLEGKPLDEMGQLTREEVREAAGRVAIQAVQEELSRHVNSAPEFAATSEKLHQEVFGSLWDQLDKVTRYSLVEANIQADRLRSDPLADYSSPTMLYTKALEKELARRVLIPLQACVANVGDGQWKIGTLEYKNHQILSLDLMKLRSLLLGCRLVLRSVGTIAQAELRYLPDDRGKQVIESWFGKFDEAQSAFLLEQIVWSLEWLPALARNAKHRESVPHDQFTKVRSQLLGTYGEPGLLIRLTQLFPAGS